MNKRDTVSILLIEDDPAHVILAEKAIKKANLSPNGKEIVIRVVRDGEAAIDTLLNSTEKFDLILLDLRLPKMDGLQVLDVIKQDKHLKVIPVVVLTTSELESDIQAAYRMNVNAYMVKPFNQDKLIDLIARFRGFWTNDHVRLATP